MRDYVSSSYHGQGGASNKRRGAARVEMPEFHDRLILFESILHPLVSVYYEENTLRAMGGPDARNSVGNKSLFRPTVTGYDLRVNMNSISEHRTNSESTRQGTYVALIVASLTLGLAPFMPEPHLFGKLRWVAGGAGGMTAVDWFDLALHGTPWLLLLAMMLRDAALYWKGRTAS